MDPEKEVSWKETERKSCDTCKKALGTPEVTAEESKASDVY